VLGCVGYGSVFLALGLYVRNPIVPAAVLLAWEGINGIRLLAAPAAPASRPGAILGLLLLTAVVLWVAGRAVRRMQISCGSDT
jgi:hypothetical protein